MQALFYALFSYLTWGSGDIFGTIASRKVGAYVTSFFVFLFGVILFLPYAIYDHTAILRYTPTVVFLNLLLGLLYIGGNITFNEASRISSASLVGTLAGSFSAVTVILSVIFLKESITPSQVAAIITIFAGVVLCSLNFKELKKGKPLQDPAIGLALFSMLTWGIYFTAIKYIIHQVDWFWPNYLAFLLFPLIWIYGRVKKETLRPANLKAAILPMVLSALILRAGDFSFNYGITHNLTSLVAPIAGAYPTLYAVLAYFIFRDPISSQQKVGIFVTLVGIVALSRFS